MSIRVEDCSGIYRYYWWVCQCGFAGCSWVCLTHSPFDIASCEICEPRPDQMKPALITGGCLVCKPLKYKLLLAGETLCA